MGNDADGKKTSNTHGERDYPALAVLAFLLVALVVAGYFSFQVISKGRDFMAEDTIRGWIQNLEERVRQLVEQGPRVEKGRRGGARQNLVEGYRLYQQKKYAAATEAFNRAIQADPRNGEAYFWRGRALIHQGRFENAMEDFQQAVTLKKDYAEAYENLGWLYDRLGQSDRGIDALSKAIEIKPDSGWAYYQRGRMLFKTGQKEKAIRDAEKSCSLGFQEGCKAYETFHSGG